MPPRGAATEEQSNEKSARYRRQQSARSHMRKIVPRANLPPKGLRLPREQLGFGTRPD